MTRIIDEGGFGLPVVKIRLVKEDPIFLDRKVSSPKDAVEIMCEELSDYDREVVCVLNVATDGTVINMNMVSVGNINSSIMSPRELFKSSILSNAAAIIMVHNHPSGNAVPSRADFKVTERIYECGQLLDIPLVDHIIVPSGGKDFYSFKENGDIGKKYDESRYARRFGER